MGEPTGDGHAATCIKLTTRQLQIARLVACCLSNTEVARLLGVCPSTVKGHLRDIRRRIGAESRQDLALYMIVTGEVSCEEIAASLLPRLARVAEANEDL